jgi:hypothetical protein
MSWLKSIPLLLEAFKEGKEISNVATWQNRTVATNACVALLGTGVALAQAFGHGVAIDQETLANLGAGIVAAVAAFNAVMHTITSSNVGLPAHGLPAAGRTNTIDME